MYIGVDFLIGPGLNLYLSEVNTGVPGGASEYDLIHRVRYGQPSGIFDRINSLSEKNFGKDFYEYINSLPYIDDLRSLKIWMDGEGPLPKNPAPALRLEDKWIQYLLLSDVYQMIPTMIYDRKDEQELERRLNLEHPLVLKKRLGRGGKGFRMIEDVSDLRKLDLEEKSFLIQPYIESQIGTYRLSLRVLAFLGEYICMFANLAPRLISNHGFRFGVYPGDILGISDEGFKTKRTIERAWEADIFYQGDIPDYMYDNVYIEDIAQAELILPHSIHKTVKESAASISQLYMGLDLNALPKSYIEE